MQHLDEGTIHAWLDGQLPPDEAQAVEAHVAECRRCADAVAEARGLIAASSRILTALDGVPREVVPRGSVPGDGQGAAPGEARKSGPAVVPAAAPAVASHPASRAERRARRRWLGGPSLVAAATIVVAVGTLAVIRAGQQSTSELVPTAGRAESQARVSGPAVDTEALRAPAANVPYVAPVPAPPAPSVASANEAPAAPRPSERRGLADARPRREALPEAPKAVAQGFGSESGRAPQPMAMDAPSGAVAKARADTTVADLRSLRAGAAVAQKQAAARDEPARAPEVVAASPRPPKPDTLTAQIFRGAKPEVARLDSATSRAADAARAATGTIRGRVTDANRTGLRDVMVNVVGTSVGVTTDSTGTFALRGVPAGAQQIVARRVGYGPVNRTVAIAGGDSVTADFVLTPSALALQSVVVTSAAEAPRSGARQRGSAPAPAAAAPMGSAAANVQQPATAYGCYDLGITPSSNPARTGFRAVPRRIALDSAVAAGRTDGVWYQVRDLDARAGTVPNGTWRPAGQDVIEIEWTYGTRTARVRLAGSPSSMLRGTVEEIDRATSTGDGGTVVAVRRSCER